MNSDVLGRKQQGISLINLMVGLVISLVTILVSLTLYKNVAHITADTQLDNAIDGNLASTMLTLQLEIQAAGFGIESASVNDIKRVASTDTLQLLWRYNDGTQVVCRGLKESGGTDAGTALRYREIAITQATNNCSETAVLDALTWTDVAVLGRWHLTPDNTVGLAKHIADHTFLLDITGPTAASCAAPGSFTPRDSYTVSVDIPSAASLNGAVNTLDSHQFCLSNIKQPA